MTKDATLDQNALDLLFNEARTFNSWQDKAVADELLVKIYDLAKMAPTAANCNPMRVVFVKSKEEKERLVGMVDKGNAEKTMVAPVTALFAFDKEFYNYLPKLFPHADAKSWYEGKPASIEETSWRNGTLQAAYFILAARAMGLDCGPMSGFNKAKVKEAFFPNLSGDVNFICNLGYGDASTLYPRSPRFEFEEVCEIV